MIWLVCCICTFQIVAAQTNITKIAFGSCGHEDKPQPILTLAAKYRPDVFVFLGDNIYGDTYSIDTLQMKYALLSNKKEFKQLKRTSKLLATWDDHDYGWNDIGRHYPLKDASKKAFLQFWEEPLTSSRWKHEGIYTVEYIRVNNKIIQLILLDTRSFRDDLIPYTTNAKSKSPFFYTPDYIPHTSTDSTLLGAAQWEWLATVLKQKADVRIICTSTQFGISYNGYEAWANFPHEQQKLCELIKLTKANGVLFISGDVHYGEISTFSYPGLYPLYDVTSSGITSTWKFATPNRNRIEGPVMENHFGMITIHWLKHPLIEMEIIDVTNNQRVHYKVPLSALRLPR